MSEWFTLDEGYENAKEEAFKYLTRRERSGTEVRDYLVGKGFEMEVIERVLEKLQEWGYIDDRRYCRLWVKSRTSSRGKGSEFLKKELLGKGIAKEIIEDILRVDYNSGREYEVAYELAAKKVKSCQGEPIKVKAKLWRYLAGRGFNPLIIEEVLEQVLTE